MTNEQTSDKIWRKTYRSYSINTGDETWGFDQGEENFHFKQTYK